MVEDVLVLKETRNFTAEEIVLILVVVEDVLVHELNFTLREEMFGLNPCCGGRCSSTYKCSA